MKIEFISSKEELCKVHAKFHFMVEMWVETVITESQFVRFQKKRWAEMLARRGRHYAISKRFQELFHLDEFGGLGFGLQPQKEFSQAQRRCTRVLINCQETQRQRQEICMVVCLIYKGLQIWPAFASFSQHIFSLQ